MNSENKRRQQQFAAVIIAQSWFGTIAALIAGVLLDSGKVAITGALISWSITGVLLAVLQYKEAQWERQ